MFQRQIAALGKAKRIVADNALKASVIVAGIVPGLSMAQGTDPFDTAVSTVTTKVTAYSGALVTVGAIAVVSMIALKYVKKLPRAS